MTKTVPWHSEDEDRYHNNNECKEGQAVPPEKLRQGTGRKAICATCEKLNSEGK